MEEKNNSAGIGAILAGVICVALAMALLLYNIWDDARASLQAAEEKEVLIASVLSDTAVASVRSDAAQEEKTGENLSERYYDMPVKEIDGVEYVAILSVPDLKLELPVRNDWSYNGLAGSPCRYTGSAYMDDLVICAHNYSRHFGRLKELENGSEILLVDMEGRLFRYRVAQIEILLPAEIEKMIDSEYDLSLFTCTLGGRTRVTVRCVKESE